MVLRLDLARKEMIRVAFHPCTDRILRFKHRNRAGAERAVIQEHAIRIECPVRSRVASKFHAERSSGKAKRARKIRPDDSREDLRVLQDVRRQSFQLRTLCGRLALGHWRRRRSVSYGPEAGGLGVDACIAPFCTA